MTLGASTTDGEGSQSVAEDSGEVVRVRLPLTGCCCVRGQAGERGRSGRCMQVSADSVRASTKEDKRKKVSSQGETSKIPRGLTGGRSVKWSSSSAGAGLKGSPSSPHSFNPLSFAWPIWFQPPRVLDISQQRFRSLLRR